MDELRALLSPVSVDELLARYWGREALYIAGAPDKHAERFDLESFPAALARIAALGTGTTARVRARFNRVDRPPGMAEVQAIAPGDAQRMFELGATICVNALGDGDARLAAYERAIEAALAAAGIATRASFNAYWSSHGHGFEQHFDTRIATTLQLAGQKTWRFTRCPVIDWPLANAGRRDDGTCEYVDAARARTEQWPEARPTSDADFEEVTLSPGDVFIVPAGAWHAARAVGESFAINLAFERG